MYRFFLILILLFNWYSTNAQILCTRDTILMGSQFNIAIIANDSVTGGQLINDAISEIIRIENLISDWIPTSQVSLINRNAGIKPVKVDEELFLLTKRALMFSEITNGAFDISIAAMERIWKFDDSMTKIPTDDEIKQALKNVGYQNIILNEQDTTIYLKNKDMKIGFGATGKGYAADMGRLFLKSKGIKAGIVDASGDMSIWSHHSVNKKWRIGVKNPYKNITEIVSIYNGSMATSGNYEKFAMINGKRYAHIVNPVTGMPSDELTSATVIGPNAEWANGFSTAIMVLGKKKGLKLLKKYPNYTALLICNNGKIKKARNFKKYKQLYLEKL